MPKMNEWLSGHLHWHVAEGRRTEHHRLAFWAVAIFLLGWVGLQQAQLVYLHSQVEEQSIASSECRADVEVLRTSLVQATYAYQDVSPHLILLESSLAGLDHQLDVLLNASRTGWWSPELLAVVGREHLYRQRVMAHEHPDWYPVARITPSMRR